MKKITVLLMLMIASVSFGQLKRVEVADTTQEIGQFKMGGKLYFETTKNGDVYTFKYRDQQYKTMDVYKSFELVETGNDFETLYNMIVEGLETLPAEPVRLELKDYVLWLDFGKPYGAPAVRFTSAPIGDQTNQTTSDAVLKKQVDKIFGKEADKKKKK